MCVSVASGKVTQEFRRQILLFFPRDSRGGGRKVFLAIGHGPKEEDLIASIQISPGDRRYEEIKRVFGENRRGRRSRRRPRRPRGWESEMRTNGARARARESLALIPAL